MSKGPASFCPSGLMFPWKNQDSAWPPLSLQGDSEWCFQIALWDSGDTFKANVGQPELKCRNLFLIKYICLTSWKSAVSKGQKAPP